MTYDQISLKYCDFQLFQTPAPVLRELPDCGKRYIRKTDEIKAGECLWNCEVVLLFILHWVLVIMTLTHNDNDILFNIIYYLNMKQQNYQWTVENPFFNYSNPVTFGANRRNTFLPELFVELYGEQLGALGRRKFQNGKNFTIQFIY